LKQESPILNACAQVVGERQSPKAEVAKEIANVFLLHFSVSF